jgi:phosphohistidine phosphatase SixA
VKENILKKVLIAVRHGSYDDNLNLSEHGKKQMENLAVAVKDAINGHNLKISLLCSTAPRALQGGEILVEMLGIPQDCTVFHECLWDDSHHPGDSRAACALVEEYLQDGTLVLVLSHLDMVPNIARFTRDSLGAKGNIVGVDYAQGMMVTQEGVSIFPRQ